MKISGIFNQFKTVERIAGVNLHNGESEQVFKTIVLKNKADTITIEKNIFGCSQIKDIAQQMDAGRGIPVSLSLNGKGILHRKISETSEDDAGIIKSIVPGGKSKDFYLQRLKLENGNQLVSLVRKDFLNGIVENFADENLYVIQCVLGPFCILPLMEMFNENFVTDDKGNISISGHRFHFNENKLDGYNFIEELSGKKTIRIGNEIIEENAVLPFANAFNFFLKNLPVDYGNEFKELILQNRSEYFHKTLFLKASRAGLAFVFVLLVANFFFFARANSENQKLEQELSVKQEQLYKLSGLQAKLNQREQFLSQAGSLNKVKTSFFADRAASTIPMGIHLSELSVFPLEKKKVRDENLRFSSGLLEISGTSSSGAIFNSWIQVLNSTEWIQKTEILDFKKNNNGEKGEFTLLINLK